MISLLTRTVLFGASAVFAVGFVYGVANRGGIFSARMIAAVFLLLPALSALSALVALRSKPKTRTKLALAFAACFAALYLCELLLPLFGHFVAGNQGGDADEPTYDERDKVQVVLDLRSGRVNAVPSIEPKSLLWTHAHGGIRSVISDGADELLPLGGVANRETVLCNQTGAWITHLSDRYGMNNPDRLWGQPIEVAAVGDACANGWCCEPQEHFVSLIRGSYPATVTLGMSGNGPLLMLASLLEYLPEARPKKVLWFHYEGNDFLDLEWERRSALLMRYLESDVTQNLRDRQDAIDREVGAHLEAWIDARRKGPGIGRSWRAMATLRDVRAVLGLKYHPPPDYELWSRVLARARRAVESWGGQLYLVYLPGSDRYRSPILGPGSFERVRLEAKASAEKLGIEFVDVHEAFTDRGDPLSLFIPIRGGDRVGQYGHYTTEGNELVAAVVIGALAPDGAN